MNRLGKIVSARLTLSARRSHGTRKICATRASPFSTTLRVAKNRPSFAGSTWLTTALLKR